MQKQFDAIIIGAGVIGASIALALARQGMKTLNVDELPAAGFGSTSNSSGVIRPFYSAVESCALAYEARHRWVDWPEFLGLQDERGLARYEECGMLILLNEEDRQNFRPSLDAMKEVRVAFQHLTIEELRQAFPVFEMTSFSPPMRIDDPGFGAGNGRTLTGGIFIPEAGYVSDPQLAAHNLQRAAESLGSVFKFNSRVEAIHKTSNRVSGVTTDKGERIKAAVVVNAAGPHSSKINALAGVSAEMQVSTRAERHEVAHVPAPAGFADNPRACVVGDGDVGVYFRPETGKNLVIGSLDPECDARHPVDADDFNAELTEQWTNQIWRAALRMPMLTIPNTARGVVGLYDTTPDWVPVYDKSALPGFYMAIGTSGNQFKTAPVVGELMAELIVECEAGRDHDTDPVSFRLPALKRTINVGFFSRNRALHIGGTGSVLA